MISARYLLPILCGALLSTAKSIPIYTVDIGGTDYELTTDTTSFAADSTLLASMPWWGNVGLTYAFSSTLNRDYGYDGTDLAVFAIGPVGNFSFQQTTDVYGNPISDFSQAIAVNTNDQYIPFPYISDEDPNDIVPYAVLVSPSSSVPDTSSTFLMLGFALACGAILLRQTTRTRSQTGSTALTTGSAR